MALYGFYLFNKLGIIAIDFHIYYFKVHFHKLFRNHKVFSTKKMY